MDCIPRPHGLVFTPVYFHEDQIPKQSTPYSRGCGSNPWISNLGWYKKLLCDLERDFCNLKWERGHIFTIGVARLILLRLGMPHGSCSSEQDGGLHTNDIALALDQEEEKEEVITNSEAWGSLQWCTLFCRSLFIFVVNISSIVV